LVFATKRHPKWFWLDFFELAISDTIADASHHQDDMTFLVDNPYKPLFATVTGGGG